MARAGASWEIGLGIIDYLALLRSDRQRGNEREEFNDILRSCKTFATSFNEGRGVPVISPWQIRRESYREAIGTGAYSLNALADTAEAERSSDQIMSFLSMQEKPNETTFQILKLRDGEVPPSITLETDFRNAYIGDKGSDPTVGGGSQFGFLGI
jgi:hypothetical protein